MMLDVKILLKSMKTNSCREMRTNLCTHWEMFLNKEHNVYVKYSNLPRWMVCFNIDSQRILLNVSYTTFVLQ